jgi:hypothetical protein
VSAAVPGADAVGMFESGIGPGVRSNRFGTWALITLLGAIALPAVGPHELWWLPIWACAATTLGAIGFGIAGLFRRGQRRPAVYGLLKAALPTLVVGAFVLLLLVLSSTNFE